VNIVSASKQNKKRHHYIPIVYLKGFCDAQERVVVYFKDAPNKSIHVRPSEIAFERYYYSQPMPDGGMDHNTLEDFFQKYESDWPEFLNAIREQKNDRDLAMQFFTFVGMMKTRVPASRDAAEIILANNVLGFMRQMDAAGKLPPKPPGREDILDHVQCAIDPHQSIHAMKPLLDGFAQVLDRLGFEILSNRTAADFITTDNPVIYFDPSIPHHMMFPYTLRSIGEAELFFPLDAHTMAHGHTKFKSTFVRNGFQYRDVEDVNEVRSINQLASRFGYKMVFAKSDSYGELVEEFAQMSPVVSASFLQTDRGTAVLHQMVFGSRPSKPKWRTPE
jgi:hypothetical protein